jgi:glycosyltransferase involved in cell wall biosynthesis
MKEIIYKPRVTVVTGYYNRASVARESVQSILDQTFNEFEYLIFDDCSTDGTLSALLEINDPRIRIIQHKRNIGFVRGMIATLEKARGDIIAIHGSGDISNRERLAAQVAIFDQFPNVGLVGCCRQIADSTGMVIETKCPRQNITFEMLHRANVFSHGEMSFRKSIYDYVGGYRPEFIYTQDYDLWLRIAKIVDIWVIPKVLYTRRIQNDAVSFQPEKLILQAKFGLLARKLIELSPDEQENVLKHVRDEGITNTISTSEPFIQRRILHKITKLGVVGRWNDVTQLLKELSNISPQHRLYNFLASAFYYIFSIFDPRGQILSFSFRKARQMHRILQALLSKQSRVGENQ